MAESERARAARAAREAKVDGPDRRRLLVLGAGRDQCFMLRCARELGIETLAVDGDPDAPGRALADDFAAVSNRDVRGILGAVERLGKRVHGVSTMGSDIPHVVAAVARSLGLPSIPMEAAEAARDKLRMKDCFARAGILVPEYHLVDSPARLPELLAAWGRIVLKPLRQAGSRGVSLVSSVEGLEPAWQRALRFSEDGSILAERFLPGDQISSESLIVGGDVHTPGLADRNYEELERFLPQIMENGGWVPSRYRGEIGEIDRVIGACARALGIEDGVIKGDLVRTSEGRIAVIEVAARLSGGDFSESLVPLGTGVNYVKQVIRQAVGEAVDTSALRPVRECAVANRYFFPPPGRLIAIEGVEAIAAKPWIRKLELWVRPGDTIPAIDSHGQRAGVFIVQAQEKQALSRYVQEVYESIGFVVEEASVSGPSPAGRRSTSRPRERSGEEQGWRNALRG